MTKNTLFIIVLLTGFTINLNAQSSASTNTNANAKLLKAMTIAQTNPLNFGSNLLTSSAGGTVVLPSDSNTRAYTGGVATSAIGPVATNATYTVTGTALETYALTLPSTTTVTNVTSGDGLRSMDITSMLARFNTEESDATTSTIASDGTDNFSIGGTLTVGADQIAGVYSGTFTVSVDYN
jgi:hypothetical protein